MSAHGLVLEGDVCGPTYPHIRFAYFLCPLIFAKITWIGSEHVGAHNIGGFWFERRG